MAETITAPEYLTNLFQNGVYHIDVNGKPYESGTVYDVDDVYTVTLNDGVAGKLPLALLFASMQIGLAEVASCKAESYMNKIVNNQEIQIACSSAINEANKLKETAAVSLEKYLAANPEFIEEFKAEDLAFALVDDNHTSLTSKDEDDTVRAAIFEKIRGNYYQNYDSVDDQIVAIKVDFETACTKVDAEPVLPQLKPLDGSNFFDEDDNCYYVGDRYPAADAEPDILTESDTYSNYEVSLILLTESGKTISLDYNLSATSTKEAYYTLVVLGVKRVWKEQIENGSITVPSSDPDLDLDPVLTSTGSAFPILSDEFVANCVTAGIYEVDGVQLCEMKDGKPLLVKVDENGEPILVKTDANGKPILATVNDDGKYVDDKGVLINESDVYIDATGIYILDENGGYAPDEDGKPISKNVGLSGEQLDELITDLGVIQDKATTTTQTDMVYAEDYLGQYNSYLNGGSSNIDDLSNSLQTIAQRI